MAREVLDSALVAELLIVKKEMELAEKTYQGAETEIARLQKRIDELKQSGEALKELRKQFDEKLADADLSDNLRELLSMPLIRELIAPKAKDKGAKHNKPTKEQVKEFYHSALAHGPKTLDELKAAFKAEGYEGGLRPDLSKDLKKSGDKFALKK